MSNQKIGPAVDADGHILEPPDLWLKYIDPTYRDRAIRIDRDEKGWEVLMLDNKPAEVVRGTLGALGGVGMNAEELLTPGKRTYMEGCPLGSYDPKARLKVMDDEGIDIAMLYPTIGIFWEGWVQDPKLATAYSRAYNRWLVDFCSYDKKRLFPIAHISLLDPEGAVEETLRAKKDGCVGVYLSPDMVARGHKHFDHPDFERFWRTVQDLQMPVGFHVVVRDQPSFNEWIRQDADFGLFNFTFLAIDVMAGFTQMMSLAMFEKYPRMKCTVLESGANWISAWLDRMDHKYIPMRSRSTLKLKPSEYFYRQCVVSADPDETMTAEVVKHVGPDYFVWASDYPHIDSSFGVAREIRERIEPLPADAQRKVLGGNAIRFYNLPVGQ
ncbi:MAG: amidohydrolase [Deltaproteobacteria bacterium]|nr:amidohydrolase [Deltaproteobacteria bacterium]